MTAFSMKYSQKTLVKPCMLSAGSSGGCLGFLGDQSLQCVIPFKLLLNRNSVLKIHVFKVLFYFYDTEIRNYVQCVVKELLKQARI